MTFVACVLCTVQEYTYSILAFSHGNTEILFKCLESRNYRSSISVPTVMCLFWGNERITSQHMIVLTRLSYFQNDKVYLK